MTYDKDKDLGRDANRDPITGAPGAHPVGTGIGAAIGGAATGAAVGTVAGPVGTAIGAAAGAIVGGLAGKGVAEAIDPTAEDAYWNENYASRPYYSSTKPYQTYQPAYRYGWESRAKYADKRWDDVEPELRKTWADYDASTLGWDDARPAVRDAWDRVGTRYPDRFTV